MLIGYMRVSSSDERHLHQGRASGARDDRPDLKECLGKLRKGDVLIVWKLDRLGRSPAPWCIFIPPMRSP